MKNLNQVQVEVLSMNRLLSNASFHLALDNYQRPYVWKEDKITQLLQDLETFAKPNVASHDYYMGTLLLHRNEEKERLYVIDGQQRLTSLFVLHNHLFNRLPENSAFEYRSALSIKNIQAANTLLNNSDLSKIPDNIFDRLLFTVITVELEDLAFTFFDTQNNRGVPLAATDLLKAFHLRAVNDTDAQKSEILQKHCARRWEVMQVRGEDGKKQNDFAPELFHHYLWRARNWTGQKVIERESHDDVLHTFQAQSVAGNEAARVPLYPGINNRLAGALTLQINDHFKLHLQELDLNNHAAKLPFSLRQPIHQGVGFFLYAEKYAAVLKELLHTDQPQGEVKAFREFYDSVVKELSHYLRELYLLATVMYFDQFGEEGLLRFALWLDHVLGAIRFEKSYIFKEAPIKYLKESDYNLLDVIAGSFRTEEVIAFLKNDKHVGEVYSGNTVTQIETGKGVQGRYKHALEAYYGRDDFTHKHGWITDNIIEERLI
jgi:hypothetical protein